MISENPQSFLSINESILEERLPYYTLTKRKCENWAQATQRVLIESWLEGNCLTLNDRLSMHYSVECRSPFLDADLTDHALSIETDKKILLATKKHLKLALTKDLPDSILSAPKSGFTPPVNLWKKSICENFQGEYQKCKVLHDFIKIENIDKQDFDLYYKLIIMSFVINKLITN
jgi:asparagine synthase (glutamine-hydrolysing)